MADIGADIELDELDVPLARLPSTAHVVEELPALQSLQTSHSVQGLFDPSPSFPLFFPSSSFFDPTAGRAHGGKQAVNNAFEQDLLDPKWQPFWRQETDEDMKAIWQRDKLELTREWKMRHGEAKKHRRRRGGVDEMD